MFLPVQDNQILAHRRGFGGERSYKYISLNKNRFVKTGTICRKTEEWFLGFLSFFLFFFLQHGDLIFTSFPRTC